MDRKNIGKVGERLAEDILKRRGMKMLDRNWRSRYGEVDIIARDRDQIVFVEVKTKTSGKFGEPWEMVTEWKREQVKRMGEMWCQDYGWDGAVRMDVVALIIDPQGMIEDEKYYENV